MSNRALAPHGSGVANSGALQAASLSWGARAAPFTSNVGDCCDDCGICCKTMFCPCQTYSAIDKHINGREDGACGHCVFCCLFPCTFGACCMGKTNRTKLRKVYGLTNDGCGDCCTHCFCHCCAMCQEMREIDFRQHALNTTQRTAAGAPVTQTVEVHQGMVQQAPGGYMQPPTYSAAQLQSVPSQNQQQIYRLPSGQLVMLSQMEPVSPVSMAPSSPESPQFLVTQGSGSFPGQQQQLQLTGPANPPSQQVIEEST